MKNATLSFDDFILEKARKLADDLGLSFNAWVNKIITKEVENLQSKTVSEMLDLSKAAKGNSKGKSWSRDEIYER